MQYNAIGEIDISPTPKRAAGWLDALADYAPAVGRTDDGVAEIVITFESELIELAANFAAVVLTRATGQLRALTVMTTEEYDRRTAAIVPVELVGTTEAAKILGLTRQRVQQLAASRALPSIHIGGKALAFSREAIDAYASARPSD